MTYNWNIELICWFNSKRFAIFMRWRKASFSVKVKCKYVYFERNSRNAFRFIILGACAIKSTPLRVLTSYYILSLRLNDIACLLEYLVFYGILAITANVVKEHILKL